MGRSAVIKKIHNAAINYKNYFIGNTYMFVFDNYYTEVCFKKSSFLHLTGVGTRLHAGPFFEHAITPKGLKPSEIFFDNNHPYDLSERKTQCLIDLFKITISDVFIASDITTTTFVYKLGITNLEFVVCLGDDKDSNGNILSHYLVPYSFRVENLHNSKYNSLFEITHVFVKKTHDKKYQKITFGNKDTIKDLNEDILNKCSFI